MRRLIAGVLAVALVAAGSAASADAPTRTVTMPAKLYEPASLDILVGTTVSWKNDDSTNHTATAENDAFASGYIPPGGTFSYTFTRQGRFEFRCTIHKQMRGVVDVFGLVLAGPEAPVTVGRQIVFAGLAPPGTQSVTLRGASPERSVRPREDGSFALRLHVTGPALYRAVAGALASPPCARSREADRPRDAHRERASCLDVTRAARRRRRARGLRPRALRLAEGRSRCARSALSRANSRSRQASNAHVRWSAGRKDGRTRLRPA